jgi:hypothetical protein
LCDATLYAYSDAPIAGPAALLSEPTDMLRPLRLPRKSDVTELFCSKAIL